MQYREIAEEKAMTQREEFIVLNGPCNRAIKIEQGDGSVYYGTTDANGYAVCKHEDDLPGSGRPSWDSAPSWAEWLAQDADGGWWFYSDCPESDAWRDEWQKTCGSTQHVSSGPSNRHWRTTLERRPESGYEVRRFTKEQLEEWPSKTIWLGGEPDLIIKDTILAHVPEEGEQAIVRAARLEGYRIEWDSNGIRGWKEP